MVFFSIYSKQRHNKLWRSHSDSDLSDRPESICKSSSPSLRRADSHNNNTPSPSPSLHHFLGVAVLQALGASPEDSAKSSSSHTSDTNTLSNSACESPLQEEVRSDCEDPVLLPLPRPRAATVIPEERLDNSARVAVTVPVALPHPPPSLHILPPTPELQRTRRGALTLNLPNRSGSEEVSPLTLGSSDSDSITHSLSDSASEKHTPLSPETTTHLPLVLPLAASDDNNNPSELRIGGSLDGRGEADGSSSHSADSIDFFTAREKFLGLAQDGQTRTLSDQSQRRTPPPPEGEVHVTEEQEQWNGSSQVEATSSFYFLFFFNP